MQVVSNVLDKIRAPFVKRVQEFNIADMIRYQRDICRQRKWLPMGRMYGLTFGFNENARYNSPEVQEKWARAGSERKRCLMFTWDHSQDLVIGDGGNGQFVFPLGIPAPPKVMDNPINTPITLANPPKQVSQDITDYADGYITLRGDTCFLVFQPVTSMVIQVGGVKALIAKRGKEDPSTGTHPALLYDPISKEAHLVGGLML